MQWCHHMHTTTNAIQAPALSAIAPEFIRLPKTGTTCPHTGLSRSYLNQLVLPCSWNEQKPPVRSVVLRKSGCLTGVRLICYRSLMTYLRGLETESN